MVIDPPVSHGTALNTIDLLAGTSGSNVTGLEGDDELRKPCGKRLAINVDRGGGREGKLASASGDNGSRFIVVELLQGLATRKEKLNIVAVRARLNFETT